MSANCCCTKESITDYRIDEHWITGEIVTDRGKIPVVSTKLDWKDRLGALAVRCNIGRMNYRINPGLYAVGTPDSDSLVLVSANYKLTFDSVRKELAGINCWIMILDTNGINVWCAAGKGTFGTAEVINRIELTKLSEIVSHRRLILPQLGAPGVSGYEVTRQTGFTVLYGPVRAEDISAFLNSGCKASDEMRRVKFTLGDRAVLVPVEFMASAKTVLFVLGILFLINLAAVRPFGAADLCLIGAAVVAGTVFTPVLLPFIPGRAFAVKGWLLGAAATAFGVFVNGWCHAGEWLLISGYLLLLPSYCAFLAMNFTGSSTYTSFSGVLKEMRRSLPVIITSMVLGAMLLLVNAFMR